MDGIPTLVVGGAPVDIAMDIGMDIIGDTGTAIDMDIGMATMLAEGQAMLPAIVPDHANPYKVTFIETGRMESKTLALDLRQDQAIPQQEIDHQHGLPHDPLIHRVEPDHQPDSPGQGRIIFIPTKVEMCTKEIMVEIGNNEIMANGITLARDQIRDPTI